MTLDKPTTPRLTDEPGFDFDVAERLTRALKDSALIVAQVTVGSEHKTDCALVTDGRRGWLVLVDELDAPDAATTFASRLARCLGPTVPSEDYSVRAARMHGRPRPTTALPIWTTEGLRQRVEIEYESVFAGAPAIDHDRLVRACRERGYPWLDEHDLRQSCLETAARRSEQTSVVHASFPAPDLEPDPRLHVVE
ncbi:MAG: hypothetical protein KC619_29150 [Myxococcales bacterium]|nr:hypothetical protein [Myxococcales bacterium]